MAEGETFTWDERKRESVLKKHGVDFQTAIRMFGAQSSLRHRTAKANPGGRL